MTSPSRSQPMTETPQWPNNICGGDIRYAPASNYDGFYLADVSHGIPTFGSVSPSDPVTIRGQHVRVFNYPGQTEQIAAELVKRWNEHTTLKARIEELEKWNRLRAEDIMTLGEEVGRLTVALEKAKAAVGIAFSSTDRGDKNG